MRINWKIHGKDLTAVSGIGVNSFLGPGESFFLPRLSQGVSCIAKCTFVCQAGVSLWTFPLAGNAWLDGGTGIMTFLSTGDPFMVPLWSIRWVSSWFEQSWDAAVE